MSLAVSQLGDLSQKPTLASDEFVIAPLVDEDGDATLGGGFVPFHSFYCVCFVSSFFSFVNVQVC